MVITLRFSLDRGLSFPTCPRALSFPSLYLTSLTQPAPSTPPSCSFYIPWRKLPSMSTFVLAGGDQSPENVESIILLYRIDLVLLSIIGLFLVAKLPQVIALFGTTSEWFDGHILHYIPYSPSANRSYPPQSSKTDFASNISHTLHSHDTPGLPTQRVTEKGTPVTMRYPPHVGSCIEVLRPVLKILRLRTSPGFSIAQSLIFFIYSICLVYATFYKSNIFTDQTRTGWVVIAQLPFLFLLAQKNNVLGLLLGYGYEKVSISQRPTKKNESS